MRKECLQLSRQGGQGGVSKVVLSPNQFDWCWCAGPCSGTASSTGESSSSVVTAATRRQRQHSLLIYGVIDIRSMKYTIQILGLYVMFALHCKLEIKFGFQRSFLYFIYMPKSAVDFPFYQCNAASTISHNMHVTCDNYNHLSNRKRMRRRRPVYDLLESVPLGPPPAQLCLSV